MDGWTDSPGDWLAILGIAGIVFGFLTWVIRVQIQQIGQQVVERTAPIQPEANGGRSLPDVAAKLDLVIDRQSQIAHSVEQLRESNDLTHKLLAQRVDTVHARLDDHAASPAHDRRRTNKEDPA